MMKGLPASGKSTRARELVASGNYIRVNRDELRIMLHDNKWSGRNEDMTVLAEKSIAKQALLNGLNVVVDDCNLNPRNETMWAGIAKEASATFETENIKTPLAECVKRDLVREKKVGTHVIVNMALQYGLYPEREKGFVLCDLDGTLCDITHRLQYAKGNTKDWCKFFAGISEDTLRDSTMGLLAGYATQGHEIIFVSARPEDYREVTEEWLAKHCPLPYATLIMRKANDKREDSIVKQQILDTYFKGKYPIYRVIDDRPRVIRMWRDNGLEVDDVGSGEEF